MIKSQKDVIEEKMNKRSKETQINFLRGLENKIKKLTKL